MSSNTALCDNLNALLKDICEFLSNEERLESMSPKDREFAKSLIMRSKVHLKEISIYSEYVDMGQKPPSPPPKSKESTEKVKMEVECPFNALPAVMVPTSEKCGELSMKIKMIFGIEKMKKVYAGIHTNWLLIYNTYKDNKPLVFFDLSCYTAKENLEAKNQNRFELVSLDAKDKKIFFFMASTRKDMLQWVAFINQLHKKPSHSENTELPEEEEFVLSDYDIVIPPTNVLENNNAEYEEDDETYAVVISGPQNTKKEVPPELPKRPNFPKVVSKQSPPQPTLIKTESEESFYDEVVFMTNEPKPEVSSISEDSFSPSEDSEDRTYDEIVADKKDVKKTEEHKAEIHTTIQKPQIPFRSYAKTNSYLHRHKTSRLS